MKVFDYKILRKLLNQVDPYRYTFIVTILISILFSCLSIGRPLLIQYAFDNYILSYNSDGLLKIMIVIFILLFLEAFFQFLFVYKSNYLAQTIIKNIRDQVFSKIVSFKIAYFDTTPTGQLITRVISDLEAISSVFSQGLVVIFGDFFKMLLILLAMFIVNWKLALVSLLFLPFLVFATFLFQKYMKQAFIEVRKQIARINIFVYEHIIGMSIIQIFGREEKELELFKMINAEHRNAHIKTVLYFSVFLPIVDVCSAIAMGILVWYGAINAVGGDVTIGEIIAFILFINMLFRPLRGIADRFNILQMGVVASTRVFKILENNTNIDFDLPKSNNTDLCDLDGDITFKNVNFSYNQGEPVLQGVNLKIDKNKTLAIIGPTGSGKTTIINLLMKWYDLLDGDILINNQSVSNIANSQLRRNIGIVLQDNFFLADTLMNNIKFFNKISDNVVFQAVREIGLESFINKFPNRYNYYIGERGSGLSEGEKQLVMFLRTYLLNPSILILDEATSSLDPLTENLIQRAIQKITTERTSIIIAHRLSTIKYAHKIVLLENGNIIESGSHDDLIKLNGKYANYYYQQFIYQ